MDIDPAFHAYIVEETVYADGKVVIEEGSVGSWVYLILEGKAKVKKRTPRGMVTIDTLKKGEIFGEMVFLLGRKGARSASVIAAEGPLRVGLLDTEKLTSDYEAVAPELKTIIQSLMAKLRDTTSKVCSIVVAEPR
jgi:CRP/FNR family transcriptional regulator, cyclic AMP receptor protein